MCDSLGNKIFMKLLGMGIESDVAYEYLLESDRLTILTVDKVVDSIKKANSNPKTEDDVCTSETDLGWKKTGDGFGDWERVHVRQIEHQVSDNNKATILDECEFLGQYTCIESITGKALRSTFLFPMVDSTKEIASDGEAKTLMKELELAQGTTAPLSYNTQLFDMQTDESFSRIFFYGIGCPLLEVQKEKHSIDSTSGYLGPFVVDMPLQDLKVRKGFRKYGARVHFSSNQQVTAIFDYGKDKLYFPSDVGWGEAKFLAKVTAFTLVTAREHLIWTHMILSNTVTRDSILHLSPDHPIRRLLTVFTFGTTEVNLRAFDSLIPETSLLHRALGLEYESVQAIFDMSYEQSNIYEPFADRELDPVIQKMSDSGKFPYVTEGKAFFEIVRNFVREWLLKAGDAASDDQALAFYNAVQKSSVGQKYEVPDHTDENMVNLIAQIIFTVTAYHELVGGVVDYVNVTPNRAGFRLCEEKTSVDLQSFLIAAVIGASTSTTMPELMSEFKNFFGSGGAPFWERDLWENFLDKLRKQSDVVKSADAMRPVEFKYFDPARLECSVSV